MKLVNQIGAAACLLFAACGTAPPSAPPPTAGKAEPAASAAKPAQAAFDQTFELQGITFKVACAIAGATNKLTITPTGLQADNTPMTKDIDGTVTAADIGDINADGSPEIYVFVKLSGPDAKGQLVAYSANKKKSLSEIYLAPISDRPMLAAGYLGHDEFAVVENRIAQRFPIYSGSGPDAKPTGKMRQMQYELKPGEAGWTLKLNKTVDF